MIAPPDRTISEERQLPLHLLLILSVRFLAYSNSFFSPFVFDDRHTIVTNPFIRHLGAFFTDPAIFISMPRRFLGYLTLALNYRMGGLAVTGYHAFNLALHLATAVLLYCFCRTLCRTPIVTPEGDPPLSLRTSLYAALIFVAHPVQTQAVTYITQRFTVLATLFYVLTALLFLRGRLCTDAGRPIRAVAGWYGGAFAAAICAMLSKEISFTLPLALLLIDCTFFRATTRQRLIRLGPFLSLLALIPLLSLLNGGRAGELAALFRGEHDYLVTQPAVIATYIRLILLPIGQRLDYDYPLYHSLATPRVLAGMLLILTLCALAGLLYRRSRAAGSSPAAGCLRLAAFGICWFFLALGVESVIPLNDLINEHRLYLPSVGGALAAGGVLTILEKRLSRRAVGITVGCVVFLLAATTWKRNLVWSDELLLWSDAVAKAPGKARPHYNLGTVLSRRGLLDAAEHEFRAALAIDPGHAASLYNLGVILAAKGDTAGARADYEAALRLDPGLAEAHNSLGTLYSAEGEQEKAIACYRTAIRLDPDLADPHNNLGAALGANDDLNGALTEIEKAIQLAPDRASYHENLARVYELKGWKAKAVEERQAAARLQGSGRER